MQWQALVNMVLMRLSFSPMLNIFLYPEDGGRMFLSNIGTSLPSWYRRQ
jgi:hypothetical protein